MEEEIKKGSPKKAIYKVERKSNFLVEKDDSGLLDQGAHVISERIFGDLIEEIKESSLESPVHESTEKKL